ncbi:MAG: hypothetical protein DRI34_01700 [Deltaproteobacteria bacterium]|nr:MAG: hypothetical protein DRI34_01700 [Deltaproteobacteria bacterium]
MLMKAYILPSGVTIHPFGDPVSRSMIGNRPLHQWQEQLFARQGIGVERIESAAQITEREFFLTWDDVFFTRRVLDDFARRAPAHPGSSRCGLPADSLLLKRTRSLQDLDEGQQDGERLALYRLYFVRSEQPPTGEAALQQCLQQARPLRARFREKVLRMPAPRHISGFSHYQHPVTSSIVMHLRHWVHLLWANQLSIQVAWVERVLDHKLWSAGKLLGAGLGCLLRGRLSRTGFLLGLLGRANHFGRGCVVHPTARVEGSLLGDNVHIGAYALVRGCLIGNNVTIEDRANVYFSVVGDAFKNSKNSTMVFCAGYPDSDLCVNGIQACLFGSRCALTSRVWVIDLRAAGKTRVYHQGRLQEIDNKLLGACFGHGCWAGLDVTIAQGREIPNGAMLIRPPADIIRRIPPDLPPGVPAWSVNGTATPAAGVPGQRDPDDQ